MSQSQKASIVEGVGEDIDIGDHEMMAKTIVSTDLMGSEGSLSYASTEGRLKSTKGKVSYDEVSNVMSMNVGTTLDVSKGMLRMSQSQKASIVEGVGEDIDIGDHEMMAKTIVSTDLMGSEGSLSYASTEGRLKSTKGKVSYDEVSNVMSMNVGTTLDVSKGMLRMSQSQKASIVDGASARLKKIALLDCSEN